MSHPSLAYTIVIIGLRVMFWGYIPAPPSAQPGGLGSPGGHSLPCRQQCLPSGPGQAALQDGMRGEGGLPPALPTAFMELSAFVCLAPL